MDRAVPSPKKKFAERSPKNLCVRHAQPPPKSRYLLSGFPYFRANRLRVPRFSSRSSIPPRVDFPCCSPISFFRLRLISHRNRDRFDQSPFAKKGFFQHAPRNADDAGLFVRTKTDSDQNARESRQRPRTPHANDRDHHFSSTTETQRWPCPR